MNPDNNALNRTYFIGGPPRVGKSILAFAVADSLHGHVVSTDSIRNAAKKSCSDKESDLFVINRTENVSEDNWLKNHLDNPKVTVEYQNRESQAVWPSVVSFCNSFCEDDAVHVVEGVAIIPSLVAQMESRPAHVVFVGNTSSLHLKSMIEYAERFPEKDWMKAMGYTPKRFEGMANFIQQMSLYFKTEAEKYGFQYYEINDTNFEDSVKQIVQSII